MPLITLPIKSEPSDRPVCDACDVAMRLFGVEPHPAIEGSELRTYVCPRCDNMQTAVVSKQRAETE
jgi:hypothetical protein